MLPDGSPCEIPSVLNPEKLFDGSRVIRDSAGNVLLKMPKHGYYFDHVYHPLKDAEGIEELEKIDFYSSFNKSTLRELHRRTKNLYENTDYALMLNGAGNIYEQAQNLRGWDTFILDLIRDPEFASLLLDKILAASIKRLEQILPTVDGYIQVIQVGDDLGTQNGPQISPQTYREIIKPRHKKLFQYIKNHSRSYLFLHTCGSIREFIPDFIEIGVDIINPVQVNARDMDTSELKEEFGEEITFWGGGCDTQKILPFGTPRDVEKEVIQRIRDLAPGGGFVFAQVHNIQAGVPPENIMKMYNTVKKYGKYPLREKDSA